MNNSKTTIILLEISLLGCHGSSACIIYYSVSLTVRQLTGSRSFLGLFKRRGLKVVVIHGGQIVCLSCMSTSE